MTDRWNKILQTHVPGQKLIPSAEAYIRGHIRGSKAYEKLSMVATAFYVQYGTCGRYRCKQIMAYHNGRFIPILKSKVKPSAKPHRSKVLEAMRDMVHEQIQAYRANRMLSFAEDHICPLTGKSMIGQATHVHHTGIPFIDLAEAWATAEGISLDEVKLKRKCFAESRLTDSWRAYHAQHARLILTSAEGNLKQGAKPDALR